MSTSRHTERITELKTALAEKTNNIEQMSNSWSETTDEKGSPMLAMSDDDLAKYQNEVSEAQKVRDLITTEAKAAGLLEFLAQPEDTPAAGHDAATSRQPQYKSLGEEFLTSDVYQEMKAGSFRRVGEVFTVDRAITDMQTKDVFSALGGNITIPTIGRAENLGWTDRTLRPGRVRDLFPAERTTASVLYGIRETGYTNRAAVVPERTAADGTSAPVGDATDVFGLKPKSELTIVPQTYPIATIAHIMYVHRNTLDDEPRLRGLLDRDMVDGVKMAEDAQLLYGDGVGDNLTGLMNTPGIQTYTGLNTDKRSAQIRRAATRAILAYFQPTGVVMHPFDWESIELETDLNGAYTVAISVAVGGEKRVWRLNVVDTPAITQGQVLVGAFGTGAKVYDRETVNVQVSTENRDLFERNAYTLRAEERLGLVVDRPESFVRLTLTTPA